MISIIMPTYNRAYIIERAIKSVLKQTYEDWELIIIDDASTDNTAQVVQKYVNSKIHYYSNYVNRGANVSRNIGVDYAKGEFLTFLDSDNYWTKDKLQVQMDMLKKCTDEKFFLYGMVQIVDGENSKIVPEKILSTEELKSLELCENVIDMNTILIKKSLFFEIGKFNRDIPRLQDWELVLRMLFCYHFEGIGCNRCLSFNEIQEDSISRDDIKYLEAMKILLVKYMCEYLDKEILLNNLSWILYEEKVPKKLIKKVISEIGMEQPELFPEALERVLGLLDQLQKKDEMYQKSVCVEELLYIWHTRNINSQKKTFFSDYFYSGSKVKRLAIYGMGKLGILFYNETKELPVQIVYAIDRKKIRIKDLKIMHPEEILEPVDLIVITNLIDEDLIKNELQKKNIGEVITLKQLVVGTE